MRYWRVEIIFPIWSEDESYYIEANNEEEANIQANDLAADMAESFYPYYDCDEEYDDYMDYDNWVFYTTYNLVEVSYEEAKEYL